MMIHRVLNKRSNRSQIFFKIGVLKNFANFTGKHLFDSLFNEVAFATFLRTPLEHLSWLLLKYITVLLEKYKYSVKKGVLKNFAIFTGKNQCWSLFFDKVAGLLAFRPTNLLKRDSNTVVCFTVNIPKPLRIPILRKHNKRLLLTFLLTLNSRRIV